MPQSKLPSDSYRKSDIPSIQEAGSHIVEAHVRITNYSDNFVVAKIIMQISGGQSDASESSVQESSQLLVCLVQWHSIYCELRSNEEQPVANISRAGCSAKIDRNTIATDVSKIKLSYFLRL